MPFIDSQKLDFNGYNRNWPAAFSVSSLDCLGGGSASWSPIYFGIRVALFVIMFIVFICSVVDNDGHANPRYICLDTSQSHAECAASLSLNVTQLCNASKIVRTSTGDGVGWSNWECTCTGPQYLGYLTYQILLIQLAYLFLAAFATYQGRTYLAPHAKPVPPYGVAADTPNGPWFIQAVWALQSIQIPGTFLVFVLYWGLVFKGTLTSFVSPLTHGLNFFVALAEWMLSKHPMYYIHVVWFFAYAVFYLIFNLIWYGAGATTCLGENFFYSALDFNQGASTWILACFLLIVAVPGIFCFMTCAIQKWREVGKDQVLPSDDPHRDKGSEQGDKSSEQGDNGSEQGNEQGAPKRKGSTTATLESLQKASSALHVA